MPSIELERFSLSGDVGGQRSFTIAGHEQRRIQVITVGVLSTVSLVLIGARLNFQNPNIRLRVQVRGSSRFFQSTGNKVDNPNPNKVLFTETTEARAVELQVFAVNRDGSPARLHPNDGWWLEFSLNKAV